MFNIERLPLDLQEKIYFIRDNLKSIIIQKYWRRKYINLKLAEIFIIYILKYNNYKYYGFDITDNYTSKLIIYICNNFKLRLNSNICFYLWRKFFTIMEGSFSEYIFSFLQDNTNYKKSINEYINLKNKLTKLNINIFDEI